MSPNTAEGALGMLRAIVEHRIEDGTHGRPAWITVYDGCASCAFCERRYPHREDGHFLVNVEEDADAADRQQHEPGCPIDAGRTWLALFDAAVADYNRRHQ